MGDGVHNSWCKVFLPVTLDGSKLLRFQEALIIVLNDESIARLRDRTQGCARVECQVLEYI